MTYRPLSQAAGQLIAQSAAKADQQAAEQFADRPLLADRMAEAIAHTPAPGEPIMEPYTPET